MTFREIHLKLVRFGSAGAERPGLVTRGRQHRRSVGRHPRSRGRRAVARIARRNSRALDPAKLPRRRPGARLGACVGGVGKFIAIGLNYADHAAETGAKIPSEPIVFMKATSCIVGPNDTVLKPRGSTKMDWEVELGVVIGSVARYVSEADAPKHIAGYCVINDLSERALPARARRPVGQGQGLRHLRTARPVARHLR